MVILVNEPALEPASSKRSLEMSDDRLVNNGTPMSGGGVRLPWLQCALDNAVEKMCRPLVEW
jgi:hypothetical protein